MATTQFGTVMPYPKFVAFDDNGKPVSGGLLWSYIAGTTTPIPTYSDVDLAPGHANTNPVVLDAAGRATVYLTPGTAYKFVLQAPAGAVIWTQDNVGAVPGSSPSVDVVGTAGEAIAASAVVYMSDGSEGLSRTAGQWYAAAATAPQTSSTAGIIGIATAAIPAGAQGTIRTHGQITISGASFAPGAYYYVSNTAGALQASPGGTYSRLVGQALDVTTLLLGMVGPTSPPTARTDAANVFTQPQLISSTSNASWGLYDASQPADARRFRLRNDSQQFRIDALNDAETAISGTPLILSRTGNATIGADLYEKGRTTAMGHWVAVPFNASSFTAYTGTWTVSAGNIIRNKYMLIGKSCCWQFRVQGSTCSAAPAILYIQCPVVPVGESGLTRMAICISAGASLPSVCGYIDGPSGTLIIVSGGGPAIAAGTLEVGFTAWVEVP
jgi:hypothetical protein